MNDEELDVFFRRTVTVSVVLAILFVELFVLPPYMSVKYGKHQQEELEE